MHKRFCWIFIILIAAIVLNPAIPVSAQFSCDTTENITFPPNWYTITAKKIWPDKPIIKQQLDDLYARGDLSNTPDYYFSKFTASVKIEPGTLSWNTVEYTYQTVVDPPYTICTGLLRALGICHVEKIANCVNHKLWVYRSIKRMNFFLIPDQYTISWLENLDNKPTLRLAYPDYWMPIVVNGGGQTMNWTGDQSGLHFLYPGELVYAWLPSYLYQQSTSLELFNNKDPIILSQNKTVLSVCDVNEGVVHNYGDIINSNYSYDCSLTGFNQTGGVYNNNTPRIQYIEMSINGFPFDIPGNFALGVTTEIDPAVFPDTGDPEPIADPNTLLPSNISSLQSSDASFYINTAFSVWMIVTTPCSIGDNGCDLYGFR